MKNELIEKMEKDIKKNSIIGFAFGLINLCIGLFFFGFCFALRLYVISTSEKNLLLLYTPFLFILLSFIFFFDAINEKDKQNMINLIKNIKGENNGRRR